MILPFLIALFPNICLKLLDFGFLIQLCLLISLLLLTANLIKFLLSFGSFCLISCLLISVSSKLLLTMLLSFVLKLFLLAILFPLALPIGLIFPFQSGLLILATDLLLLITSLSLLISVVIGTFVSFFSFADGIHLSQYSFPLFDSSFLESLELLLFFLLLVQLFHLLVMLSFSSLKFFFFMADLLLTSFILFALSLLVPLTALKFINPGLSLLLLNSKFCLLCLSFLVILLFLELINLSASSLLPFLHFIELFGRFIKFLLMHGHLIIMLSQLLCLLSGLMVIRYFRSSSDSCRRSIPTKLRWLRCLRLVSTTYYSSHSGRDSILSLIFWLFISQEFSGISLSLNLSWIRPWWAKTRAWSSISTHPISLGRRISYISTSSWRCTCYSLRLGHRCWIISSLDGRRLFLKYVLLVQNSM